MEVRKACEFVTDNVIASALEMIKQGLRDKPGERRLY